MSLSTNSYSRDSRCKIWAITKFNKDGITSQMDEHVGKEREAETETHESDVRGCSLSSWSCPRTRFRVDLGMKPLMKVSKSYIGNINLSILCIIFRSTNISRILRD